MTHLWLTLTREDIQIELAQAVDEGRDVSMLKARFDALLNSETIDQHEARDLLSDVQYCPIRADYSYEEPEPSPEENKSRSLLRPDYDKIYGAWLGRCCGCLLGKPIEGWKREQVATHLKATDNWPLSRYIERGAEQGQWFIEDIAFMPEDDDINYTVAGLGILERYGREFTSEDVGSYWLANIPILSTCTAERVAYRNMVDGIVPPKTALQRNPYREWIGAQIRADLWGYVNPGSPEAAAQMAIRDAAVSHVKNGIYGEMWAAAMVAAAFSEDSAEAIVRAGLSVIPQGSRLAHAISGQLRLRETASGPAVAIDDIHSRWNEHDPHHWCHVISNAEIVAMALLWGGMELGKTICLAVQAAFDTDCNGATCGSIVGAALGAGAVGTRWREPMNDTVETGVRGFSRATISELSRRTLAAIDSR